jgi:manganese/zinc/iron transport system permease protein
MTLNILAGLFPPFEWHRVWADPWSGDAFESTLWILALSVLIGISCALVGTFLLLRRMALTGDAISHSVLPGLVAAYVIFGSLDSWAMVIGAASSGLLAVLAIEFMHRKSRLKSDAATGVAFTTLFALGVLMIRKFADRAHLDVDCVLYGNLEFAIFDQISTPFGMIPATILRIGVIALILLGLTWLFYKELLATSFDASLAKTLGLKARWIHYGLMTATSLVVVASLEAVGAVLVVGMMIVPPATARLLANRLPEMLLFTLAFVVLGAFAGRHLAAWLNTPLAASTMVASGMLFFMTWSLVQIHRLTK